MKLGTLSKNHIIGLILFLECGLIFCFVWFYAMPTQKKIAEIKTVIVEKQRQVREIENTKRQLAETKIEIEKLKIDINRLEKFTREEVYIPRTLVLLEKLAESTRMTILRIAPSSEQTGTKKLAPAKDSEAPAPTAAQPTTPPRPGVDAQASTKTFNQKDEFRTSGIDIEFSGEFRSMYSFMGELASFPKLVVVEKIDISRSTQAASQMTSAQVAQTNKLSIKMPMTFYIQKKASLVTIKGKDGQEAKTEGTKPGGATQQ